MTWMVIRVRGTIHARGDIEATLHDLHLTRANHATIVPESPDYRGMIYKVQGYVTWGEADSETVEALLAARGVQPNGHRLVDAPAEGKHAPPVAKDLLQEVALKGLARSPKLRPLFRLRPPKGGWRSTKKPFTLGGALGYRGRAINDLARKML